MKQKQMRGSAPSSPIFSQSRPTGTQLDFWNREEIYDKVWKLPIGQVAREYEVSTHVLVKVCQKLQIPRPDQGHWGKVRAGMPVVQIPLPPPARNLPFVARLKKRFRCKSAGALHELFFAHRDDAIDAIARVESTSRLAYEEARTHRLTSATASILCKAKQLDRGCVLQRPYSSECLDVRVSKKALDSALRIMNAILFLLQDEGFGTKVDGRNRRTIACLFEQEVPFYLREKLQLEWRSRKKNSGLRTAHYRPTGNLEFRCGASYLNASSLCDSTQIHLDHGIHLCVAALMREARRSQLLARQKAQNEFREERKRQRLAKLSTLVAKEEGKLDDLHNAVATWRQAQDIRQFVAAVAKHKPAKRGTSASHSRLSDRARIKWMKRQADRLDPFAPTPPSVLDRKPELASDSNELLWPMLFEQAIFTDVPHTSKWWARKGRHFRDR